ncbi:MAG: efflux RND transporter periplasmic adaptor subunit [Saprospiraceae bacterium]|nr:efflux RND transporter periplasmic adaptor subunit [Saprospiraceae bacterium]
MIKSLLTSNTNVCTFSIFAFLLIGCNSGADSPSYSPRETQSKDETAPTVEVVFPEYRRIERRISVAGTAMPNRKVTLCALESGVVKSLHKEIGDRVRQGEILAELEHPGLLLQYEKSEALMNAKKAEYERLLAAREQSAALTPAHALDAAKGEYLALQASWKELAERIGYLKVAAPFSGTVTRRFVDQGTLLTSGIENTHPQPLYEIQQTDPIRLHIPLPEADIPWIHNGMEALVSFPELVQKRFSARISRMAKALDPQSKTMDVELDIANSSGDILPGMYAVVEMIVTRRDEVLSLPAMAKIPYSDKPQLLVVRNRTVEQVSLQQGLSSRDFFEVLNPEIDSQTMVVLQGKQLVEPGTAVNPIVKNK